jgi:hypothetical protein
MKKKIFGRISVEIQGVGELQKGTLPICNVEKHEGKGKWGMRSVLAADMSGITLRQISYVRFT